MRSWLDFVELHLKVVGLEILWIIIVYSRSTAPIFDPCPMPSLLQPHFSTSLICEMICFIVNSSKERILFSIDDQSGYHVSCPWAIHYCQVVKINKLRMFQEKFNLHVWELLPCIFLIDTEAVVQMNQLPHQLYLGCQLVLELLKHIESSGSELTVA